MRNRKRSNPLVVCAICVLAALFLTVASAWIPALFAGTGSFAAMVMPDPANARDPNGRWRGEVPDSWDPSPLATTKVGFARQTGTGVRVTGSRVRYVQGDHTGVSVRNSTVSFQLVSPERVLDRFETGWPWNTMATLGPLDSRQLPSAGLAGAYLRGIPVPEIKKLGLKPDRAIPLRPMWGPFGVMVALWMGVLIAGVVLWRTPRWVRRRRRVRGGLCLNCGYDLSGITVCPECNSPREPS